MLFTQKGPNKNSRFEFSIALTAPLLFLIALVSLLGTFPTDPLPLEIKGSRIANTLIALTRLSGGRDLYASPFFIILLGALGSFVSFTILGQIRAYFKRERPIVFTPVSDLRMSLVETQGVKNQIARALSIFGYHLKFFDGEMKIEGSKNLSGALGPLGIHLGFVIVLLAGLTTWLSADIRETEIREGEALALPKERRELRLDKFIVFRHAGSDRPSQYTSRFWIKGADGKGDHVDLSVNHPLRLGRTKIFQMRYRVEIPRAEILVYENGKPVEQVLLDAGKPYALSPDGPTLLYDKIVPDFKLTKEGIVSVGNSYERSAMRVKIQEKEGDSKTTWIFPAAFGSHGGSEKGRRFGILKLHKVHISGVRISYDPGLFFAYPGLILLIFSAFYSSFVIPRRLRFTWNGEGPHDIQVKMEGWCPRDPSGLEEEVRRLVKGLS